MPRAPKGLTNTKWDRLLAVPEALPKSLANPTGPNGTALPLMDWIAKVGQQGDGRPYQRPLHLAPFVNALQGIGDETLKDQRLLVSTPPRHGKTETVLHAIVWLTLRRPGVRVVFATYSHQLQHTQERNARRIIERAAPHSFAIKPSESKWELTNGSKVYWTSVKGELTGLGCDVLVIDDPIKSRLDVESAAERANLEGWFQAVAMTRVQPGGSAVAIMTRWKTDDLGGHMIAKGFDFIRLPAVAEERDESGAVTKRTPLWPAGGWTLGALDARRAEVGEYDWSALYQGEPVSREGQLFGAPTFYDWIVPGESFALPETDRISIGIDLAYSVRTKADYSVAIALMEHDGRYYVVDVMRRQVTANVFLGLLLKMQAKWKGAACHIEDSGPETGVIQLFRAEGLRVRETRAGNRDKFARGQRLAGPWAAERIQVPSVLACAALGNVANLKPDVEALVQEFSLFTGKGDKNDDCVDALCVAYEALKGGGSFAPRMSQEPIPFF